MSALLKKFDMFGAKVPALNIGGRRHLKTSLGAIVSICVMSTVFLYSTLKLQFMLLRKRPEVISFVDEEGVPPDLKYKIRDVPFKMAFSVKNWFSGQKNDPRYVQWVLTHIINDPDAVPVFKETNYPTHVCTEEDFKDFYEIDTNSAAFVEKLKENDLWFCFD